MFELEVYSSLKLRILNVDASTFDRVAMDVFNYQFQFNPIYRKYVSLLYPDHWSPAKREEIPCIPISCFKSNLIQTGSWEPEAIFYSSGTTGSNRSAHAIRTMTWYHQLAIKTFENRFGPLSDFVVLALLPSYLEQENSSLVNMVTAFMQKSQKSHSGFFMYDFDELAARIHHCQKNSMKFVLWGVSYALLDFADAFPIPVQKGNIVIETGGMKGRKKEMMKSDLLHRLKTQFHLPQVYSEYGMTELLSQAYTGNDGLYSPAPTMRVQVHEINDLLVKEKPGKTGLIQVIDLANLDSCSFISTDDLGTSTDGNRFTISGRLDYSDLRGCSLLYPSIIDE